MKTIELCAKKVFESHAHNLIKTLRVFKALPYDNRFDQIQSILLEQIPGFTFLDNKVRFNQISVLEYDYKIFFWRRIKNPNKDNRWEMQLWKYNIQNNKLEQVIYKHVLEGSTVHDRLDEFTIPCDADDDHDHHHHGEGSKDGFLKSVTSFAGKIANATKSLFQKEAKMNGTGQLHLMFGG